MERRIGPVLKGKRKANRRLIFGSDPGSVFFRDKGAMNPIISAPAADPWMIHHQGLYFFCESRNHQTIHVRKSSSIPGIGHDKGICVWAPPQHGPCSQNVWAPELHFLNGRWYIYFAADDGRNENHRMWVLESEGSDPQGIYHLRGSLETQGWAIDGTVLQQESGEMFYIWSGWPTAENGQQNLYIAPMANPWTLGAERSLLCVPDQPWEKMEMAICEGPQILRRNGKTFIIYSASGSWTEDYCLGMLVNLDGNLLNRESWTKKGPVFSKTADIWGVGHCSFVKSPCQSEDWILYHAKSSRDHGWMDRQVLAQPFRWDHDDHPNFGEPRRVAIPASREMQAA